MSALRPPLLERLLLPAGVSSSILRLLAAKALRAFADGYMAVLLPAYLLALGFGTLDGSPASGPLIA